MPFFCYNMFEYCEDIKNKQELLKLEGGIKK